MQFAKPRKLVNSLNPGSHFMNTAMYDAREVLGGQPMGGGPRNRPDGRIEGPLIRREDVVSQRPDRGGNLRHDPLTYIGPDRQGSVAPSNLPIPVGIFMNMAHVPPRFYNQHQQMLAASQQTTGGPTKGGPPPTTGGRKVNKTGGRSQMSQGTGSQDTSQGAYLSQGPYTQGGGGMSQGGGGGLSLSQGMSQDVGGLSQDSIMGGGDLHSQLDGLLSQDSTYQGDRLNGPSSQFSQLGTGNSQTYLSQFSQQ